jgi:uncharacterized protein YkwD
VSDSVGAGTSPRIVESATRNRRPLLLRRVAVASAISLGLLLASNASAATPSDGNTEHTAELAQLINRYREQHRLAPLAPSPQIARLAQLHSARMAKDQRMSHEGFEQRLMQSGFHHCVENVGWNYPTAAAELSGWQRSSEHDRNLLDSQVTHMGIGVQASYVTFIACN